MKKEGCDLHAARKHLRKRVAQDDREGYARLLATLTGAVWLQERVYHGKYIDDEQRWGQCTRGLGSSSQAGLQKWARSCSSQAHMHRLSPRLLSRSQRLTTTTTTSTKVRRRSKKSRSQIISSQATLA